LQLTVGSDAKQNQSRTVNNQIRGLHRMRTVHRSTLEQFRTKCENNHISPSAGSAFMVAGHTDNQGLSDR
jgi:hypothetical protein